MSKYIKNQPVSGSWVKGSEVVSGMKCKLVSETVPTPSQFKNKDGSVKVQDVAKIQFADSAEAFNINVNRASLNALIDAFGEESVKWQGKSLTAITEKVVVGGKRVTAVYLVPDGYTMSEDANGYVVIVKEGAVVDTQADDLPDIGE